MGAVYDSLMFVKDSPVAQGKKRRIKKYRATEAGIGVLGSPIGQLNRTTRQTLFRHGRSPSVSYRVG
jgi:hypothetical protein